MHAHISYLYICPHLPVYLPPAHTCPHLCAHSKLLSRRMPYSHLHAQMMAGVCSHLPPELHTLVLCLLIPACAPTQRPLYMPTPVLTCRCPLPPAHTWPQLGSPVPLPQARGFGGHSHDAAQSPDVRLAGVPVSGHDLRGQEVWGPTEHSGGHNGASGRLGPEPAHSHPPREPAQSLPVTCGSGLLGPPWWPAPGLRSSPPCSCSGRSYLPGRGGGGGDGRGRSTA